MNLDSMVGFGVAGMVLWYGVIGPSANPAIFLDSHALILVLGGTLAAAAIAFPIHRILGLFKMFIFGVLLKTQTNLLKMVMQIIHASPVAIQNPIFLKISLATHPFLKEGFMLIAENRLTDEEFIEIIHLRSAYFKRSYLADAKMLNALAKFPPAFGLLGATTGMISMMTNLGGKGGQDAIGPSMAVALVATFWGIAVANLILLPLSDYAQKTAVDDSNLRQIITEGLIMLKQKKTPYYVAQKLSGYLPVHQRLRFTEKDLEAELAKHAGTMKRAA